MNSWTCCSKEALTYTHTLNHAHMVCLVDTLVQPFNQQVNVLLD